MNNFRTEPVDYKWLIVHLLKLNFSRINLNDIPAVGWFTESAVDGRLDWLPEARCRFNKRSLIFSKEVSSSSLSLLLKVKSTTIGAFFFVGGASHTSSSSPSSTVSMLCSCLGVFASALLPFPFPENQNVLIQKFSFLSNPSQSNCYWLR